MKSYVRSFLDYCTLGDDDSTKLVEPPKSPKLEMNFLENYDAHYHTIEIKVTSEFITLVFNIDIYKKTPEYAITLLGELVEHCYDMKNGNRSTPIVFDGNSKCFFRPGFQLRRENDRIILEPFTYTYNRTNERFSVIFSSTVLSEIIDQIEEVLKQIE